MPFINDLVLDSGLAIVAGASRRLDICTSEPATYAAATGAASVGNKTGITVPAPEARSPSGRKVVVPQVTTGSPGSITAGGTATHWALSDPANSRLLAAGALSAGQVVTSGNTFSTSAAFDIGLTGV